MFAFGGLLQRFRGGVPGAPSAAGVPADRRAELDLELAPVFAALAPTEHELDGLLDDAHVQAERLRSAGRRRAQDLVTEAQNNSAAEQSATAAAELARAQVERRELNDAAVAEAARIDRLAAERLPDLVAEIVARILEPTR